MGEERTGIKKNEMTGYKMTEMYNSATSIYNLNVKYIN